jgi:hypothetical protein
MRRRTLRQDAFLILKLATYSSGIAGSNGFPITENDLYDVAGGVINFGSEARAGSRGRFTFRLPLGGCTGRSSREIAEHLCGCLRSNAYDIALHGESARCRVVSVRLPGKSGSGGSPFPYRLELIAKSRMKHMTATTINETFVARRPSLWLARLIH